MRHNLVEKTRLEVITKVMKQSIIGKAMPWCIGCICIV